MRVAVRLRCLFACTFGFCLLLQDARGVRGQVLEGPTGVAVCQVEYGNPGTLRISWTNPEMYEVVELFVDDTLAASEDGADGRGDVQASPGNHIFGVRGLVGESISEVTRVEFEVLEESPVPEPITDLDCEFIPSLGGVLRLTWQLGNDPWVRGRVEFPAAGVGVDIEAGATEIEVLTLSRLGGNQVALFFKNDAGYLSPPFVPECVRRTPVFRRGDCNSSGSINITDAIFYLDHLFKKGPRGPCDDACDSNNDGVLKLSDAINTLNYLFKGGPPPPAPGPIECGIDDDAEGEQDFLGGICVCGGGEADA